MRLAYSLSSPRELYQSIKLFYRRGPEVRSRFSHTLKPTHHLGATNPENRLLTIPTQDPDLEDRPQNGLTFEDMDVGVA